MKGDKMEITNQQISDCIAYWKGKGAYAYENDGRVFLNVETQDYGDFDVELSSDEIIARAELYNEERDENNVL